ncbi:MAG: hypothetical protein U5K38_13490 [Woeseiaceae bacterium]|nr:hypothetical protein [Woeseiaceae bacterium]
MAEFMDRPLKERIVGAIVLVVVAVLVVPVFLDGPVDDTEVVTETVLLPGQEGQARKQQTIVLNRDRQRTGACTQCIPGRNGFRCAGRA